MHLTFFLIGKDNLLNLDVLIVLGIGIIPLLKILAILLGVLKFLDLELGVDFFILEIINILHMVVAVGGFGAGVFLKG